MRIKDFIITKINQILPYPAVALGSLISPKRRSPVYGALALKSIPITIIPRIAGLPTTVHSQAAVVCFKIAHFWLSTVDAYSIRVSSALRGAELPFRTLANSAWDLCPSDISCFKKIMLFYVTPPENSKKLESDLPEHGTLQKKFFWSGAHCSMAHPPVAGVPLMLL